MHDSETGQDPLDDDRIKFFLRHRDVIREWAAIEKDLQRATHQVIVGLIPDIESRMREIEPSAIVTGLSLDTNWPRVAAFRDDWEKSPMAEPLIAVTLEWTPKVDPAGGALPYLGLRVQADTDRGRELAEQLRLLMRSGDSSIPEGYRAISTWWPIGQNLPPMPNWWQEVSQLELMYVDRFASAWGALATLAETALGTTHDRSTDGSTGSTTLA